MTRSCGDLTNTHETVLYTNSIWHRAWRNKPNSTYDWQIQVISHANIVGRGYVPQTEPSIITVHHEAKSTTVFMDPVDTKPGTRGPTRWAVKISVITLWSPCTADLASAPCDTSQRSPWTLETWKYDYNKARHQKDSVHRGTVRTSRSQQQTVIGKRHKNVSVSRFLNSTEGQHLYKL